MEMEQKITTDPLVTASKPVREFWLQISPMHQNSVKLMCKVGQLMSQALLQISPGGLVELVTDVPDHLGLRLDRNGTIYTGASVILDSRTHMERRP